MTQFRSRKLLTAVLAVAGLVVMSACSSGANGGGTSSEPETLTIAAWGDPYQAEWSKSLIPEFEKKYNAKIVYQPVTSSKENQTKIIAARSAPTIDVILIDEGPNQALADEGLIEKIDVSKLTNAKDMYPVALKYDGMGVGFSMNASGIFYNTDVFKQKGWDPPTSWLDLLEPQYKDHVSAHDIANAGGLNLLMAFNNIAGGTLPDVQPGLDLVKKLAVNVPSFTTGTATMYSQVQQGQTWLGEWSVDRISALQADGVPVKFVYPKEGAYGFMEVASIVKGTKHHDLAEKFIDLLLSPEQQEFTAKNIGLGPLNKNVTLDKDVADRVIYGSENINGIKTYDWTIVNQWRTKWTEEWAAAIAK